MDYQKNFLASRQGAPFFSLLSKGPEPSWESLFSYSMNHRREVSQKTERDKETEREMKREQILMNTQHNLAFLTVLVEGLPGAILLD